MTLLERLKGIEIGPAYEDLASPMLTLSDYPQALRSVLLAVAEEMPEFKKQFFTEWFKLVASLPEDERRDPVAGTSFNWLAQELKKMAEEIHV